MIYTGFVHEKSGEGAVWIGTVEAGSQDEAKQAAIAACAEEWTCFSDDGNPDTDRLKVMGLVAGTINLVYWDDHHLDKE